MEAHAPSIPRFSGLSCRPGPWLGMLQASNPARPVSIPHQETSTLLQRWLDGDESSAERLVEQLYPLVARIVSAHLPYREQSEDLIQEIFAKIFARATQFRGSSPLDHWVSRIAVTTCLDRLRHHARRPTVLWSELSVSEQAALNHESEEASPHPLTPSEARALLERLLALLRPQDRAIIIWLDLEEKSISQVARLTASPVALVRLRAFRARQRLQKLASSFSPTSHHP